MFWSVNQLDCGFRLADYSQVVVVGAELARLLQVHPGVLGDFLLLNLDVVGERLSQEEHDLLADFAEGTVLADLAEIVLDFDVEVGLLLDFADCGLALVLTDFDVTLREAPVTTVVVLDKQNARVRAAFIEDNRAAGFLVKALYRGEVSVLEIRKAHADIGLVVNGAV